MDRIASCEAKLGELQPRKDQLLLERLDADEIDAAFADFDALWSTVTPREQAKLLNLLLARVEYDVQAQAIAISFHTTGIKSRAASFAASAAALRGINSICGD